MTMTRRDVVASLSAVAASASCLTLGASDARPQASGPSRLPLQEFATRPRLVDALRRGVQVMRSRPPSDPRSWFFQGAVHAVSERMLADAMLMDPAVASVDQQRFWNRCPHFGASSAEFLIWHRAYLYYFERILRDAAQEPELALPFWDYTNPDFENIQPNPRLFPPMFAGQFLDPPANREPNPLYHPNREAAFTSGRYQLSELAVDVRDTLAQQSFFGATEAEGFAGGIGDNSSGTQGFVERRPHNQIHFAVGGVIGDVAGAMADVPTAAFDPIFWVHHANIDRLWVAWACAAGKDWGVLPSRAWFAERPWHFYDYDRSIANETRAHYVDHRRLGIRFDGEDPSCNGLQLPVGAFPSVATQRSAVEIVRIETRARASALEPRTFVIGADGMRRGLQALPEDIRSNFARRRGWRILLGLEGLTYDRPPSSGFDIYIGLEPGERPDRQSAKFVGTLALFGVGRGARGADAGHSHGGGDNVQLFDISAVFPDGNLERQLQVQLVPFDLLTPRGSSPPLRRHDAIEISGLRLLALVPA